MEVWFRWYSFSKRVTISGCLAVSVGTYRLRLAKVTRGSGSYRHLSRGLEDVWCSFLILVQSLIWSKSTLIFSIFTWVLSSKGQGSKLRTSKGVDEWAVLQKVIFDWSATTKRRCLQIRDFKQFCKKSNTEKLFIWSKKKHAVLGSLSNTRPPCPLRSFFIAAQLEVNKHQSFKYWYH